MYGFSGNQRSWVKEDGKKLEGCGREMPPLPSYLTASAAEDRWIPEKLQKIASLESIVEGVQMNIP